MSKITVPDNPTPEQLQYLLSVCSNEMARLGDIVAGYKQDSATKAIRLKRSQARATVKYKGQGNVDYIKALVEIDEDVIAAVDSLDYAEGVYILAKAELDGYDAQFVALRKIAEIRKQEMRSLNG